MFSVALQAVVKFAEPPPYTPPPPPQGSPPSSELQIQLQCNAKQRADCHLQHYQKLKLV